MKAIGTVLMAMAIAWCAGCGPKEPTIETGIIQSAQAANASLLSQVDWKNIFMRIRGQIGPDTEIVVTAQQIIGGQFTLHFRGGSLEYEAQGAGTGGGLDQNMRVWPDLMQIQQRWERASDADRADKRKWEGEIAKVILDRWRTNQATSQPSGGGP